MGHESIDRSQQGWRINAALLQWRQPDRAE